MSEGRTQTFIRGLPERTKLMLMVMSHRGISQAAAIAAGIDALMVELARHGKMGGEWKRMTLSRQQQGKLTHQLLIDKLIDSDTFPITKVAEGKRLNALVPPIRRPRGRPRTKNVAVVINSVTTTIPTPSAPMAGADQPRERASSSGLRTN